jgi:hypothetical protein
MSRPFFWTEWGRERWEQDQIQDLQYSISSAYGEASRLRSQLARVHGSLESKVDRLTAAFEAFVELSDIRADLAVYADAGLVRHHVRRMLAAVSAGRAPEPPEYPDVPGYWLVPAGRALYARLNGEPTRAAKYTEAATELDADRTRYFLTAAARLAGPVDLTAVELAALLPAPDDEAADRAQRTVWLAAAAGAFGDAGRALVGSTLGTNLGEPPPGEPAGPDDPWLDGVDRLARKSAADALHALRERCTEPTAPARPGEPTAPAWPGEPAGPAPDDGATLGPLAELIGTLVDEGHEPERELLRRIEHLRGVVEQGTAPPAYRPWYEPAGTVAELVRADIFGTPPVPGARRVAVRAAAAWLRDAAETLAERARAGIPDRATVRIRGREVTITAAGPDPATMAELRRQYTDTYRPSRTRQYAGIAVTAAGAVLAVTGFLGPGPALGVLGIVALIVGVVVAIVGARAAAGQIAYGKQERANLDAAARRAVEQHRDAQQRDKAQRDRIDAELAALSEALG